MTRIAYFQPFSGCSGDMTLGALVDAGLDIEELREALRLLPLGGYAVERETVLRGAFQCTRLKIVLSEDHLSSDHEPGTGHSHEHSHASAHARGHEHSHSHAAATHP